MCGRVVQAKPLDVLAGWFDAVATPALVESYVPRWNIPPTEPVVGLHAGTLDLYSWGLRGRFFNARAETVATNSTFAPSLPGRRLAVLVDGFFEWHGSPRRPLYFTRTDGAPMALAGLWEGRECTVLTTEAGPDLDGIHDREPVVLDGDALAQWLNGAEAPLSLLVPGPAGRLVHHAVDPRVGDVRNDGPDLIAPYTPPAEPEPLRLFG